MAALPLAAPTVCIRPHQSLAQATADELGKLQATLAPLKNKEAALKSLLRDSGLEVVEGDLFRATISPGKAGTKIDWEGLARAACSDARLAKLLPGFTTTTEPGEARVSVKAKKECEMNGLYLGCALARSTTVGDTITALIIGLILGWLLSNAFKEHTMPRKYAYTAKSGAQQWKPSFKWIEGVIHEDTAEGFCLACGETQLGVEPDARQYTCHACGASKVYGAEQLALMGLYH